MTVEGYIRPRLARLRAAWLWLVDRCIPPARREDPAQLRHIRTTVSHSYVSAVFAIVFAFFARATFSGPFGRELFAIYLGGVPALAVSLLVMRVCGRLRLSANIMTAYYGLAFCFSAHHLGGPTASALFWLMVLPTSALFSMGRRAAVSWTGIVLAVYVGFLVAERSGHAFPLDGTAAQRASLWFMSTTTLVFFLLASVLSLERGRREAERALDAANLELEEARDQADTAMRRRTSFLANMSHELRTPMTAVLGFTEVAADRIPVGEFEPDERGALDAIERSGHQLLKLVNELLDLSKIESGSFELHASPFSLVELVNEVVTLLRSQTRTRGNALAVEYVAAVPETLEADPVRLQQVLINLVESALRRSFDAPVRILIQGIRHPDRVRFEIVDSGIGMTRAQLAGVFEPFVETDVAPARRFGGTGLGLSISRMLIELMGGTVAAASEPGTGSTFTVELPVGTRGPVRMLASAEASGALRDTSRAKPPALRCRVLVVDDNADNRRLISYFLRGAGADVVAVDSGETALESWPEVAPDIVLMDIQMPRMDGYAATRALRERGCRIPIVALTAHALTTERERCLSSGFDGYGSKPIDRRRLLELVDQHTRPDRPVSVSGPAAAVPAPVPVRRLPFWDRMAALLLPEAKRDDRSEIYRARTILWIVLAPVPIVPFEAIVMWHTMAPDVRALSVGLVLCAIPLALAVPGVLRLTGSTRTAANTLLAYSFAVISMVTYWRGGLPAPAGFWLALIPIVAVSLVGSTQAVGWGLLCAAMNAAFLLADRAGLVFGDKVAPESAGLDAITSATGLFTAVMLAMLAYERARSDVLETLAALNRSLEDARDQATLASLAKTAFLGSVSQALRAPLTAIIGYSDRLLGGWEGRGNREDARAPIATVRRSGQQLLSMIDDLLDLAQVESGRLVVASAPYAPETVLREAVALLRASAEAKGLELALNVPQPLGTVRGDPARLAQIVCKLLDNAVKFTARGRVELRARAADAQLEIVVNDTGPGIPRESLGSLFTAFQQLDASVTREQGGAGLGLALCQRLVAALGGRIDVESELGRGTSFRVSLPAPPAAARGERVDALVLLVEGAPEGRRRTADILRLAGADVDVVEPASSPLARARAASDAGRPYDALLLDMQMPGLDAAVTARALRDAGCTFPILALTGDTSPGERERCLAAGCDDFVSKPVDAALLVAALQSLLRDKST